MHAGKWTGINNKGINSSSNSFKIHFLDTQQPLLQKFFYEWIRRVANTTFPTKVGVIYQWPFPRLNFAIYYYRPEQINDLKTPQIHPETKQVIALPTSQQDPNFIYFLTGCFPLRISVPQTGHNKQDSDVSRAVDFAFNNMYLFPNRQTAKIYGYQFLFPSGENNNS